MKYIPLTIRDKKNNDREINFENIITENKLSIILGAPGSGKTTLLKHYEEKNKGAKFLTIKEFLRFNIPIEETIKVLLLDGIDEYRAVSSDKTFVAVEIANKIDETLSKNIDLKIVLTCREMDWFGTDKDELEKHINEKVGIFYLQGLDKNQQEKLAGSLKIENQDEFLKQFQDSNFLTNPQLFCMLAEIWKNSEHHFSSKREIYETFIKCATKEKNETHKDKQEPLEDGEGLKLLGYLSYFYFFCGIDEFREGILEDVADNEMGYPLGKLKQLLRTNLFIDRKFAHKTIAEFALAYHIHYKLERGFCVEFEKIKTLFVDKDHSIPSKLRGAYAWLCSLSEDMELIEIDPYYQAIYGDNGSFDIETKKKVLQAVRKHSQENPYFINFSQRFELAEFYEQGLDEFLQSEYTEAIKLNNHYTYFLNKIITQAHNLSSNMEEFIKKQILDNEISHYYKTDFLEYLGEKGDKGDKKFLKEVLDSIVEKKIDDKENSLKDLILNFLYPEIIKPEEVIKYILSYGSYETNTVYMHYFYLLKEEVPFENKKTLVQKILENRDKIRHKKYFYLPYYIDVFIKDFFLDAYLDETIDVETLYECLWDFKQKFYEHESIKIEAYRQQRMKEVKDKSGELQCKSNKLFAINAEVQIKNGNAWWLYNIYNFPYYFSPTNKSDVFLSQLKSYKKEESRVAKEELFLAWINSLSQDKRLNEDTLDIAKKNGLEKEYGKYASEEKSRIEELNQQDKDKDQIREKNEELLRGMEIEEINIDTKVMYWITELYLFHQSDVGVIIKKETFENKIKDALHRILSSFPDDICDLLTIKELSKNPQTMTTRDSMFYASLCVHTERGEFPQTKPDFKKYLYMVALWYEDMQYVPKTDFTQLLEEKDSMFATETLKEYIGLLIDTNFKPPLTEAMKRYINQQEEIVELKKFIKFYGQTTTFNKFLKHFMTSHEQLFKMVEEFSKSELDEESQKTIEALKHLNGGDNKYKIDDALLIFSFFELNPFNNKFQSLDNSLRIKILTYIMRAFFREDLLQESKDAYMDIKDKCILFLRSEGLLKGLTKKELKCLSEKFKGTIWENTFLSEISFQKNKEEIPQHQIEKIKKMIFDGIPITQEMFFEEVYCRLNSLKKSIESNRDNQKEGYYNTKPKRTSKSENEIRDLIFSRLKDKYKDTLWVREGQEANNRVDINVKYLKNPAFEIQIECKKDSNLEIAKGVKDQLIDKYLTSETLFGIYLVFYFGEGKRSIDEILKLLNEEIRDYQNKDKIKILLIDFTFNKGRKI